MIRLQYNRIRLTTVNAGMGLVVVPNELKIAPTNLVEIQQLSFGGLRRMLLTAIATLGIVSAPIPLPLLKVFLKVLDFAALATDTGTHIASFGSFHPLRSSSNNR
jgi:hypothetical protein